MIEAVLQFFGQGSWWSTVLWFLMFFAMIFLYPKLMVYQLTQVLENSARKFETMSENSRREMVRMIKDHSDMSEQKLKENFDRMADMFTVEPERTDPAGVMTKIKQMYDVHDKRYRHFIKNISDLDEDEAKSFAAATVHSTAVHQIAKAVRHMLELVKETKNLQIGMVLKMQLPFIKKQIKMLKDSIECLAQEEPVGDSIGPLCAAHLIGDAEPEEVAEDVVCAEKEIEDRNAFIIKPRGPSAVLGDVYEAFEKVAEENEINKIIAIDAKGKMKGEEKGKVVEGIGFAMGARGNAERHWIEDIAAEEDIPIESIGINESPREDVVRPMRKEIYEAVPEVEAAVKRALKRTEEDSNAVIIGVGITVGVGNDGEAVEEAEKIIKKNIKKMEEEEEEEKKPLIEKIASAMTPY